MRNEKEGSKWIQTPHNFGYTTALVPLKKENLMNYTNYVVPYQVKLDGLLGRPRPLLIVILARILMEHREEDPW